MMSWLMNPYTGTFELTPKANNLGCRFKTRATGPASSSGQQGERTYGHAEDGLIALVNVTCGHYEGCARK